MKKILSLFLSFALYSAIVPVSFATDSTSGNSSTPDQTNPAVLTAVTCPAADAPVTFTGARATFMEKLKAKDIDLYNAIIDLITARRNKLAELCKNHPELYQRLMDRREKILFKLQWKSEDRKDKIADNGGNNADQKIEKIDDREKMRQERFCKTFPTNAKCTTTQSAAGSIVAHPEDNARGEQHSGSDDTTSTGTNN